MLKIFFLIFLLIMSTLNTSELTKKYNNLNIKDEDIDVSNKKALNILKKNDYIKVYNGDKDVKHYNNNYNDALWLTGC